MNYTEGKSQFIQTWGKLGTEWGINRTMAQIHALLLISAQPLSTEKIMEELSISRGNANMNLRDLIDWDLIHKVLIPGDRKEYFAAEKDIWEVAKRIARERKRREIEPVKNILSKLQEIEGDKNNNDIKAFTGMMDQLNDFVEKMDKSVDVMLKADQNWFFGILLKLVR